MDGLNLKWRLYFWGICFLRATEKTTIKASTNIKTIYIVCWQTPSQMKTSAVELMQYLLSHLLHSVCTLEFYKDIVKAQDTVDLFQKTWQAFIYTCPRGHWYNTNLVSLVTNSCNHNVYILPQHYYDMPKKSCHYSGWQTLNKNQLYTTLDYLNYIKHSPFIWLKENGRSKSENAFKLN